MGQDSPKAAAETTAIVTIWGFYEYPSEHWLHLPHDPADTTNVRRRPATDQDHQGPGSRAGAWPWRSISSSPPGPLAPGQRAASGRSRPSWRPLRTGQADRRHPPGRGMIFELYPPEAAGPLPISGVWAYEVSSEASPNRAPARPDTTPWRPLSRSVTHGWRARPRAASLPVRSPAIGPFRQHIFRRPRPP